MEKCADFIINLSSKIFLTQSRYHSSKTKIYKNFSNRSKNSQIDWTNEQQLCYCHY